MRASLAGRSAAGVMFGEILPCTEQLFQLLKIQPIDLAQTGAQEAPQRKITQDLAAITPWQSIQPRDFRAGPEEHGKYCLSAASRTWKTNIPWAQDSIHVASQQLFVGRLGQNLGHFSPWTGRTSDAKYRTARGVVGTLVL